MVLLTSRELSLLPQFLVYFFNQNFRPAAEPLLIFFFFPMSRKSKNHICPTETYTPSSLVRFGIYTNEYEPYWHLKDIRRISFANAIKTGITLQAFDAIKENQQPSRIPGSFYKKSRLRKQYYTFSMRSTQTMPPC